MDDDALNRLFSPQKAPTRPESPACFGLGANGSIVMLNLRIEPEKKEMAINYGYLNTCCLFQQAVSGKECIELDFSTGWRVFIRGRCLVPLFRELLNRTVAWVQPVEDTGQQESVVVTQIEPIHPAGTKG